MSVHLSKSFAQRVKETIDNMVDKNLDVADVPMSNGMVIVKENTKEAKKREKDDTKLFSYKIKGLIFTVCHK